MTFQKPILVCCSLSAVGNQGFAFSELVEIKMFARALFALTLLVAVTANRVNFDTCPGEHRPEWYFINSM